MDDCSCLKCVKGCCLNDTIFALWIIPCAGLGWTVGWGTRIYLAGRKAAADIFLISGKTMCGHVHSPTDRPLCDKPGTAVFISVILSILIFTLTYWMLFLFKLRFQIDLEDRKDGYEPMMSGGDSEYTSRDNLVSQVVHNSHMGANFAALMRKEQTLKQEIQKQEQWARFWWFYGRGIGFLNLALPAISVAIIALIDPDEGGPADQMRDYQKQKDDKDTGVHGIRADLSRDLLKNNKIREVRNLLVCGFTICTVVTTAITKAIVPDEMYGDYNAKQLELESSLKKFHQDLNLAGTNREEGTGSQK